MCGGMRVNVYSWQSVSAGFATLGLRSPEPIIAILPVFILRMWILITTTPGLLTFDTKLEGRCMMPYTQVLTQ